jgi:hypothetical protein
MSRNCRPAGIQCLGQLAEGRTPVLLEVPHQSLFKIAHALFISTNFQLRQQIFCQCADFAPNVAKLPNKLCI